MIESCVQGIEVSSEEQIKYHRSFLSSKSIDSPEKLTKWLDENDLTEDQASKNIYDSLRIDRFKETRFGPEVEKVFLETKNQRDRVVYSLLRLKDPQAAEELYLRLSEGDATFTDLCNEHSGGFERETGGLIGPIPLGRLHPKLAELLRISQLGQLWPPVQIDDWWVITRLDKRLPAQLDAAMEILIRNECFETWLHDQVNRFMAAYRTSLASQDQSASADEVPSYPVLQSLSDLVGSED